MQGPENQRLFWESFRNAYATFPLCCPSRASILRGQYAHNTGVFTNALPGGGFQKAI